MSVLTYDGGGSMSIMEKVTQIIVDQLGVNPTEVVPKAKFIDDPGANSLDIVEFLMALEDLSTCFYYIGQICQSLCGEKGGITTPRNRPIRDREDISHPNRNTGS